MYGMVNRAIEQMVRSEHGDVVWNKVRQRAQVNVEVFLTAESYDDQLTYRLVAAVSEQLGVSAEQVLIAFGEHWVLHTAPASEVYGVLMDAAGTDLGDFLEYLPELHSRVMLGLPEMRPPEFWVTDRTEESLILHYRSHRVGLQSFVIGLLNGLGQRFGLDVEVTLRTRSPEEDHDQFELRYSPRGEHRE